MEKENLRTVLVIIVVSMIAILSFGLVIGQLVNSENLYETLIIIISFVGIFATFGGAYLGAKIAGDNALKIAEMNYKGKIELLKRKYEKSLTIFKTISAKVNPTYAVLNETAHMKITFDEHNVMDVLNAFSKELDEICTINNEIYLDDHCYFFEEKVKNIYDTFLIFKECATNLKVMSGINNYEFDDKTKRYAVDNYNKAFKILREMERNSKKSLIIEGVVISNITM